mmetsp:Transcript_8974/g.22836  ORF Transcript_8974/g.22836 Transcript_8974/m.22836 type:complete len:247 (-) Transcript_8974:240-980(-)
MPRGSNICFGFEAKQNWATSTGTQYEATREAIKTYGQKHFSEQVNPDNKTVHWRLGTERTEYSTTNRLPDPRCGDIGPSRPVANKAQMKKTNYVLGNDKVEYDWKKGPSLAEINFMTEQKAREDLEKTLTPAKKASTNIVWGFEATSSASETKMRFTDPKVAGNTREEKDRIKAFVTSLKTCAVSFGTDAVDYSTTNRLPSHERTVRGASGRKSLDNKKTQQRSSIVFGYDSSDFETSTGVQFRPV